MASPIDAPWGTEWIGASARERGAALADLPALADVLPRGLRPEGAPSPAEKVLAVDQALEGAEVPHAIGGALAVAYYGEPRMTIDIDVNVFAATDRWPEVAGTLAPHVGDIAVDERQLARHPEARLSSDRNPVRLFFAEDALHEAMPAAVRRVPLADSTIPIISPEHLIIRKALLGRPKAWLDIEAIFVAQTPIDIEEVKAWLGRLGSHDDPRLARLDGLAR